MHCIAPLSCSRDAVLKVACPARRTVIDDGIAASAAAAEIAVIGHLAEAGTANFKQVGFLLFRSQLCGASPDGVDDTRSVGLEVKEVGPAGVFNDLATAFEQATEDRKKNAASWTAEDVPCCGCWGDSPHCWCVWCQPGEHAGRSFKRLVFPSVPLPHHNCVCPQYQPHQPHRPVIFTTAYAHRAETNTPAPLFPFLCFSVLLLSLPLSPSPSPLSLCAACRVATLMMGLGYSV